MLNAGIEAIEGGGADHRSIIGTQGDRWDAHRNRGAPVEFLAQATQGKARECSNRNEILQSDLTIRFQARDIFGGIQNLNAHNASVRSIVEGNCFAEPPGGHFSRIVAQTNVESIYFGIICYFHRFPSLLRAYPNNPAARTAITPQAKRLQFFG